MIGTLLTGGGSFLPILSVVVVAAVAGIGSCAARDARLRHAGAAEAVQSQITDTMLRETATADRQARARAAMVEIDRANARRFIEIENWLAVLEGKIDKLNDDACLDKRLPIQEWTLPEPK